MIGQPRGRVIPAQGAFDFGQEAERDDAARAAAIEGEDSLRPGAGEAPGQAGLACCMFDVGWSGLGESAAA